MSSMAVFDDKSETSLIIPRVACPYLSKVQIFTTSYFPHIHVDLIPFEVVLISLELASETKCSSSQQNRASITSISRNIWPVAMSDDRPIDVF